MQLRPSGLQIEATNLPFIAISKPRMTSASGAAPTPSNSTKKRAAVPPWQRNKGRGGITRTGSGATAALAAAALLLVSGGLAGCGSGSESTTPAAGLPKEIVIDAAIAKTGVLAPYDSSIAAVEQLVDETNAKGGIDGHHLRIVQADTRSEPQQAVVAAQQVVEKGAEVMLYTCDALSATASAAVAEEHDELGFSLCENAPGFGPPTTGRLSFTANPSLLSEASAGASFLYGKGIRHPCLFRDTSLIYGKSDCSAFQQTWEHLGGQIAGQADFKNEASRSPARSAS
jgi:branched-chain amino acid transport system substrate-binding protein